MTVRRMFGCVWFLLWLTTACAWVPPSLQYRNPTRLWSSASGDAGGVETVSLDSLDTNHQDEGTRMATSIVNWLDAEWMPQEVHVKIAESAKDTYISCREKGDSDVMSIMMSVASDLEAKWSDYDADAFVNAWDVSNYVSDYLTKRSGSEGCECTSKIY